MEKNPLVFVRTRTRWSSGTSKRTHHEVCLDNFGDTSEEALREWVEEKIRRDNDDGGEHFRGVDYEVIDRPPEWWLAEQIERARRSSKYDLELITRYRKMLGLGQEQPADQQPVDPFPSVIEWCERNRPDLVLALRSMSEGVAPTDDALALMLGIGFNAGKEYGARR
jgi:hypothetical protein